MTIELELDKADCWKAAQALFTAGNTLGAMEICKKSPCSEEFTCQNFLGWLYYNQGNLSEAYRWYSAAAESGSGEALFGLGCVSRAQGKSEIALAQFISASSAGYTRALHFLGDMYERGVGTPINFNLAKKYYSESAKNGFLIGNRKLLSLWKARGGALAAIVFPFAILAFSIYIFFIAVRNPKNPRIVDIPNAILKR